MASHSNPNLSKADRHQNVLSHGPIFAASMDNITGNAGMAEGRFWWIFANRLMQLQKCWSNEKIGSHKKQEADVTFFAFVA
jgi:hypothetical protein